MPKRNSGKKRTAKSKANPTDRVRGFFADLGPGLITGAADDDPSGISTYSVTGATFGYMPLWTAILSFPMMASVQLMCARLGMVTGRGLAGVARRYYPRWVLWSACAILVVANVFNIGADLGGMAEATEMMTGIKSYYWTPLYAVLITSLLFFSSYRQIARIFKWLTMVLFAYIAAAFLARPDWHAVLTATFVPRFEWTSSFLATLVGILGTTISPYLFFWQASQEVENDRARGKRTIKEREGATPGELKAARTDVFTGMFFSNLVMYFIILTTAATLHAHGNTNIQTARDAAEALRPIAGNGAYLLFAVGIIGTGMLGVPVLAGSAAYAVAEGAAWRGSLEDRPLLSRKFYALIAVAMLLGLALDFTGFNAVKMLFYSAVLNGVLAPPLIVLVLLLTSKSQIMGTRVSSRPLRYFGWATAAIMTAAVAGMFVTM
ncbi:MAG TPA: Nramp family divalent metal transporter [Syntrophorhabdaceae bacterium]|jgi:NRAMP (natural resistance-associated macrophage protein)-like metal ion transporter